MNQIGKQKSGLYIINNKNQDSPETGSPDFCYLHDYMKSKKLSTDFSSFQLFFRSKHVDVHILDILQEPHRPGRYIHSFHISIQEELHL